MKKTMFLLVLSTCIFIACTPKNNPVIEEPVVEEPLVKMGITVVKLSSPEYLDYVIADICNHKDSLFAIRNEDYPAQELFLGSSPYIALSNDYYAVDWKWGSFIYTPTNYLLSVKWEDVMDRKQQWGWEKMKLSSGFILKEGGNSYEAIDKFLNIAPPPIKDSTICNYLPKEYCIPLWLLSIHSLSEISDSVMLQQYLNEVKYQDSLQNIYVERLSQIIEEGRLEEAINIGYK